MVSIGKRVMNERDDLDFVRQPPDEEAYIVDDTLVSESLPPSRRPYYCASCEETLCPGGRYARFSMYRLCEEGDNVQIPSLRPQWMIDMGTNEYEPAGVWWLCGDCEWHYGVLACAGYYILPNDNLRLLRQQQKRYEKKIKAQK